MSKHPYGYTGLVWQMVNQEQRAREHMAQLRTGWTPSREDWAAEMQARVAKIFKVPPGILEIVKDITE